MKILFVTSECAPFSKSGGLADVAFSLPPALKEAGVPARMHIFENGGHGGHGYGVRSLGFATDAWPKLAEAWLTQFR